MALVRFYLPNGKGWRRGELLEIWHRFVEWLRLYNELVALTWGIAQLSYLCQRRLSWQNVSRGKLRSQKRLESFDRTNNGKVEADVSNNLDELRCCMGGYEPNLSPRTGSRRQSRKGMSVRYWTILNLFEGSKTCKPAKQKTNVSPNWSIDRASRLRCAQSDELRNITNVNGTTQTHVKRQESPHGSEYCAILCAKAVCVSGCAFSLQGFLSWRQTRSVSHFIWFVLRQFSIQGSIICAKSFPDGWRKEDLSCPAPTRTRQWQILRSCPFTVLASIRPMARPFWRWCCFD